MPHFRPPVDPNFRSTYQNETYQHGTEAQDQEYRRRNQTKGRNKKEEAERWHNLGIVHTQRPNANQKRYLAHRYPADYPEWVAEYHVIPLAARDVPQFPTPHVRAPVVATPPLPTAPVVATQPLPTPPAAVPISSPPFPTTQVAMAAQAPPLHITPVVDTPPLPPHLRAPVLRTPPLPTPPAAVPVSSPPSPTAPAPPLLTAPVVDTPPRWGRCVIS